MFSGIFSSLTEALVMGKHLISIAQTCVLIFILTALLQNWGLVQTASVLMDTTFFSQSFQ